MNFFNYSPDQPKPLPVWPGQTGTEKISDPRGITVYFAAHQGCTDQTMFDALHSHAEEARLQDTLQQYEAAYTYLALGHLGDLKPNMFRPTKPDSYHSAGHQFRELGILNRAGDAYWRAGLRASTPKESARSFSRAKACYAEVGDVDRCDQMHRCEWQRRREAAASPSLPGTRSIGRAFVLALWYLTSGYGTKFGRWLISFAAFLGLFTILYQSMESAGVVSPDGAHWTFILSALYYSLTTSIALDHVALSGWGPYVVIMCNVVLAYTLLAIGATVLGQKVLRR